MRAVMLLLFLAFNVAQAETFSAKIIVVIDGDTVVIRRAGGLVKIRLAEIDAPEKAQTFGVASKQSLSEMVLGKQVTVVSQAIDKYGRLVAHLGINGLDVNAEQIRRGMAWEYSNFHSNKTLIGLQTEARNAALGLWVQRNPIPPWVWRKQHPASWPGAISSGGIQPAPALPDASCGSKSRCSEMTSCAEAKRYFTVCKIKALDGNHDGIPCNSLCGDKKR